MTQRKKGKENDTKRKRGRKAERDKVDHNFLEFVVAWWIRKCRDRIRTKKKSLTRPPNLFFIRKTSFSWISRKAIFWWMAWPYQLDTGCDERSTLNFRACARKRPEAIKRNKFVDWDGRNFGPSEASKAPKIIFAKHSWLISLIFGLTSGSFKAWNGSKEEAEIRLMASLMFVSTDFSLQSPIKATTSSVADDAAVVVDVDDSDDSFDG